MWAMLVAAYAGFLPLATFLCFSRVSLSAIPGVPAGWELPGMGWEAKGAWAGATAYIIGLSFVVFWRFHSERWRNIKIFEQDRVQALEEPGSKVTHPS
jgi:Na+-driven multidrug efflux pump